MARVTSRYVATGKKSANRRCNDVVEVDIVMEVVIDALAGSWGSMVAAALVHPFDVAKYRVQACGLHGFYFGHCVTAMREERLGIYRGLLMSLVKTALVNFGTKLFSSTVQVSAHSIRIAVACTL